MRRTEDFRFTGIIWHELGFERGIDDINLIEDVVNEAFKIKDYGQGLEYMILIYLIDLPDTIHNEYKYYARKKKYLTIQRKIDFQTAHQATHEDYLELLATCYLKAVKEFEKWKIQDFDSKRFYEDLEAFFLKENWIKRPNSIGSDNSET